MERVVFGLMALGQSCCVWAEIANVESDSFVPVQPKTAQAFVVHDPAATTAFKADVNVVRSMVNRGVTNLTGKGTVSAAWLSLVSTQDTVGIKVLSAPGAVGGTRPAVVAAVVEGLLAAQVPPQQIIVWDKHVGDLRRAGYFELANRYGIRVVGSAAAGYDESRTNCYETPLLGQLVWGDHEFGRRGEGIGRRSFVSKLVAKELTKIINVTPLLNHNLAGVTGNLVSLTLGSVDNTLRFETDADRLAKAVPEIWALPVLGDRVVLNIIDALLCQYEGGQRSLLHYSVTLDQLWFSKDAVALDVLALEEMNRQRQLAGVTVITNATELYLNAAIMDLGVGERTHIRVEVVP
jgi:hypothetical protein